MAYILLLVSVLINSALPVTVLENAPNPPFTCVVNNNCSGSIVKYKDRLFLLTASHCVTLKQDIPLCGQNNDGSFNYRLELMPSVLGCSGSVQQIFEGDDFAIYGISKIYDHKAVGKTVDASKVPAVVLPDPDLNDVNQAYSSYFEEKAGQSVLKDVSAVECRAAGFGRLPSGEAFGTLRTTRLPSIIQSNTVSASNSIRVSFAGDYKGRTILFHGDSGGPLYCKPIKDASANWYIIGIAASIDEKSGGGNRWHSTLSSSFINDAETAYFQAYPTACTSKPVQEKVFTRTYNKKLYMNDPALVKVYAFRDLSEYEGVAISSERYPDGTEVVASYTDKYLFVSEAVFEEEGDHYKVTIKYTDKPTASSDIVKVNSKVAAVRKPGEQYLCSIGDVIELEFINSDVPKIIVKDCVIQPVEEKKIEIKKGPQYKG